MLAPLTASGQPSLRRLLWREVAVLAGIFVPLLAVVSWIGYRQVVDAQTTALSRQATRSLQARLDERLTRLQDAALALATLWQEGAIDPGRMEEARPHLLPLLRALPGKGNVLLIRMDGAGTIAVRDPPLFALEAIEPAGAGLTRFREIEYDRDSHETRELRRREFVKPYAPLERPWVEQIAAAGKASWTAPYQFAMFVSAAGASPDMGVTYGIPVRRDGRLAGYVGIDLLLRDLDALAASVRPTPASEVVIDDGHGVVLGGSSAAARSLARGTRWSDSLAFEAMPGTAWRVGLSIPERELAGPTRRQLALIGAAIALLLLLAALRLRFVVARIVAALDALERAAAQVGVAAPEVSIDLQAREVQNVRDALARSHEVVVERRALEQQLQHSQRVGLVGFLAGGLAHDMNNQLAVLIASLSAARETAPPGEVADGIAEAEQAAWRCAEMTRRILSLSRKTGQRLHALDVNAVVEQIAAMVRRLVDPNVRIALELSQGLPLIEADAVQLEQILLNLAINARDAMPGGGTVTFATRAAPSGVEIVVRDTGSGITPEVRARMFEPFFTTKAAGKGTGLGLAMVRSIAEQHGWGIEVSSEPGAGTVFSIRLADAEAAA